MKGIVICFLIVMGVLGSVTQSRAGDSRQTDIRNDIKQVHVDLKNVVHDVETLRRDQVNYRIEKDLLKEAYSSNLQIINMVITIVLGILGVLGYLGIRSIKEIRADYTAELEKLRSLKTQLESEIESLRSKQKEFESQVGTLAKTNEEQDRRLKTMELIEKISGLVRGKQWEWALKYISIGLGLDPKNPILLTQKATCHGKRGEFTSAIDASKQALEVEPTDASIAMNLLEYLALTNQRDEFNVYYTRFRDKVDHRDDGAFTIYLQAIMKVFGGELDAATGMLLDFARKQSPEAKKFLDSTWSFEEVNMAIATMPVGKQKTLCEALVAYFDGQLTSTGFEERVSESPA